MIVALLIGGRGAFFRAVFAGEPASTGVEDDVWQGLPSGPGRELVFGICQACHSLAIVKQQGLDRDSWDETLTWMVEEQGMPELDADNRDLVLDYLSTHYGR